MSRRLWIPSLALAALCAALGCTAQVEDTTDPEKAEDNALSCNTPPPAASPLVGWAAVSGSGVNTTTGGGSASPVTVSSLAQLQSAVRGTTPAVVHVVGKLAPGEVKVGSNKTIVGLCGAEVHGALTLSGSTNVIVRNLKIVGFGTGDCELDPDFDEEVGCSSGSDAVGILNGAHHVWFDHCDISDGTDGNLDITKAANFVTVSWTRFHYAPRTDDEGDDATGDAGHRFSNLVGGTDKPKTDDANTLNVTWHHNLWTTGVVERQARVRFGRNHFFNNVWNSSDSSYCVRAGKQARVHLENNVFSGVKDAHEFNSKTDQKTAFISVVGNLYTDARGVKETGGGGTAFDPKTAYAYQAEPASRVLASVLAGVGPH